MKTSKKNRWPTNVLTTSTNYYKYTLQGEHSLESAQRALGDVAVQGTIVRIDTGDGKTRVYVASKGKQVTTSKIKGTKVSESDVTKLG